MPSKQFAHLQELSLARLRARIPSGCPLAVERRPAGGFRVQTGDDRHEAHGRFEVVHAFIDGYAAAWRQTEEPFLLDKLQRVNLLMREIADELERRTTHP